MKRDHVMYTVEKAYTVNSRGNIVRDGWDVFVNGEWGNRYPTRKEALRLIDECESREPTATFTVKCSRR